MTAGTPRTVAMDDPANVVGAIISVPSHPGVEVPVGWKAQASYVSHRIAPDFSERFAANIARRQQMEKAGPAPQTTGAPYHPMQAGTGVESGVREMMKQDQQGSAAASQ